MVRWKFRNHKVLEKTVSACGEEHTIMNEIKLVRLQEIEEEKIIELMNNESVQNQMPLLPKTFSKEDCQKFIEAKQKLWDDFGYGPWAILIKDKFAGWGGLQPEHGDADFALVLHPQYWGWGKKIFYRIKDWAYNETQISSITVLFPPSRKNSSAILYLGFVRDGEVIIDGERFFRFRHFK